MTKARTQRSRFGFFDLAFTILLALFFLVSVFTCGSFQSTRSSSLVKNDEESFAVFEVTAPSTAKVKSVFLHIGSIYAEEGKPLTIAVKRSASKTTKPSIPFGPSSETEQQKSVLRTGENGNFSPFQWVEISSDSVKTVGLISVTGDLPFELNEIVCLDENGKTVELTVNAKYTKNYGNPLRTLSGAVDAPESYTGKTSARYVFTAEEGRMMEAIANMRLHKTYENGLVYYANSGAGALATALCLPAIAVFGPSVGALRITAVLFTTAALALAYLFAKLLFKNDKSAFIALLCLILTSLPFTAGKVSVPQAAVFFALAGAAYFMLKFFSRGVSSDKPVKDGLSVLYSGLFSAFALAIDLKSFFPVLGVLVLFAFGLKRQKAAHTLALEKISEEDVEERERENAVYRYKNKLTAGFALLSFAVGTFALTLLGGVLGYNSFVRAYDDPASPKLGFLSLLLQGFSSSVGFSVPFKRILPFGNSPLYENGNVLFSAFFNPVLLIVSLVACAFSVVCAILSLVKKDGTKTGKRLRRLTLVLLTVTVASLLQATLAKEADLTAVLPFAFALTAFIPLAHGILCKKEGVLKKAADIALYAVVALSAVFFLLSLPQIFGWNVQFLVLVR